MWPQAAVGETRQLPCNFSGPNENPFATRTCESRSVWSVNPEYDECYTFITMMYEILNAVSLSMHAQTEGAYVLPVPVYIFHL